MKKLFVLLMPILFWSCAVKAEGGCPAGQRPYDTPQARQCVPIPGAGSSGSAQPEVVYENRWGAVATDSSSGNTGISVGEKSKSSAKKLAIQRCEENGSLSCKVRSTFFNQCIAFAEGGQYRASATAATEKEAQERAIVKCADGNSATCAVVLSRCSLPERVR